MLPPHTPKIAPPTDKPGPSPPPSRPSPLAPVVQNTTHRHQLNAVPPAGVAPFPCSWPRSRHRARDHPPRSLRVCGPAPRAPRGRVAPAPCTVRQQAPSSPDAPTSEQARPALGPPAALPVAGPSRGGGRARGKNPSRALLRKAAVTRGRRLQTFTNGTGPTRGDGGASRAAGHVSGGLSAVALAVVPSGRMTPTSPSEPGATVTSHRSLRPSTRAPAAQLLQKGIARVPVKVNHQAPCSAQAHGQPASVTARSGTPARTRRDQHIGPDSRHGNAAGSALSAFCGLSGRIRPYNPKALASDLHRRQGVESGRRPGYGHAHRRGCVPVYVCRQGVRSAGPLASPRRPTRRRSAPPALHPSGGAAPRHPRPALRRWTTGPPAPLRSPSANRRTGAKILVKNTRRSRRFFCPHNLQPTKTRADARRRPAFHRTRSPPQHDPATQPAQLRKRNPDTPALAKRTQTRQDSRRRQPRTHTHETRRDPRQRHSHPHARHRAQAGPRADRPAPKP